MTKPLILIVEDESGIADTIAYALSTEGFEPCLCANGTEALAQFQTRLPALVILDVGLPDISGFELFRRLHALPGGAAVPMLFLTARTDEIDRVVGLEMGADDYVAKPFSPRELVARVRTILRRIQRAAASPSMSATPPNGGEEKLASSPGTQDLGTAQNVTYEIWRHGALECDTERHLARYHGQLLALTRYEYGLLATLMQRPGRVYTRDELLQRVWDDPAESFDRTVDAHIKTLRAKLRAAHEGDDPIRTLRGVGYALKV